MWSIFVMETAQVTHGFQITNVTSQNSGKLKFTIINFLNADVTIKLTEVVLLVFLMIF